MPINSSSSDKEAPSNIQGEKPESHCENASREEQSRSLGVRQHHIDAHRAF